MNALTELLSPGDRVFVAGGMGEPVGLIALLDDPSLPENLEFIQFPISGLNTTDITRFNGSARLTTCFMTPTLQASETGRVDFLPAQMRWFFDHISRNTDVALIQVAEDAQGQLRLGLGVDLAPAALSCATTVIAELNKGFIACAGCPAIDRRRIDLLVETRSPLPLVQPPAVDAVSQRIGANVAELINDGDCIQTGIGTILVSVIRALRDKNDLGLHSGLLDDACMELVRSGNINGSRKRSDTGRHVAGAVLGTQELVDWLGSTPSVVFRGSDYTHDVKTLRGLDNFVSINSALEIDLYGQVNAEFAAGRQRSGTGGSVDFMRGARASKGGRSIIAMQATARRGTVSRIVPRVEMVTALRTDVDFVVTEFGAAHVGGLPDRERARSLMAIAAPQFREELQAAAAVAGFG